MPTDELFLSYPENIREAAWTSVARDRGLDPNDFPNLVEEAIWEELLESARDHAALAD
jgi:hypothetical protein